METINILLLLKVVIFVLYIVNITVFVKTKNIYYGIFAILFYISLLN